MIHEDIILKVIEKIEETSSEIKDIINNTKGKFENGYIPGGGEACISHIRAIRREALTRFGNVKAWISILVGETAIETSKPASIESLNEAMREKNALEIDLEKAQKTKQYLEENIFQLHDYKKFQLYGTPNKTKRLPTPPISEEKLLTNLFISINEIYRNYTRKRNLRFLVGIITTIIFMLVDFSIINTMFLASNFSEAQARTLAIIYAAVLDGPPYILGILWTKRDDGKQVWALKANNNDSGWKNETKRYNTAMVVLTIAILLLFSTYFFVRFFSFLGGGNFNLAFQSIFGGGLKLAGQNFSSADLLATFAPAGTSAIAFAIGLLLFTPYSDYVEKAITFINKSLLEEINEYDKTIADRQNEIRSVETQISIIQQELWTFYKGKEVLSQETFQTEIEHIFNRDIILAFHRLNVPLYRQTYIKCSLLLREKAEEMLQYINRELSPYATDQMLIVSMSYSDVETTLLNSLWEKSETNGQHTDTIEDISRIETQIEQLGQVLG